MRKTILYLALAFGILQTAEPSSPADAAPLVFESSPCIDLGELMKTSTDKLIAELEKLPASQNRDTLLANTRSFCYHDFRSDNPCPKQFLVEHLEIAAIKGGPAYARLAEMARNGEFDESDEEAEAWFKALPPGEQKRLRSWADEHFTSIMGNEDSGSSANDEALLKRHFNKNLS